MVRLKGPFVVCAPACSCRGPVGHPPSCRQGAAPSDRDHPANLQTVRAGLAANLRRLEHHELAALRLLDGALRGMPGRRHVRLLAHCTWPS